ncbi:hypothetical protein FBUS_05436 [Fasciolopsis buskii]|uniref:DBF4-type domain-containing protein n=1 Tax=Fasciolopsis buskii TaxID=27845 RepID=A0A8E0S0E7_9TREM|nr:hypothetical protein FBUS_05436 [Fasciolopsis buski]
MPDVVDCNPVDSFAVLSPVCTLGEEKKERKIVKSISPGTNRLAPLQGKRVFMHYEPETNPNNRVETILRRLKAELVDFFSRDVSYVITNRPLRRSTKSLLHSPSDVSAMNNKCNLGTVTSKALNQISAVPEGLKTPKLYGGKPLTPTVTRGRAMLIAARKSAPAPNEAVRNASPLDAVPSSVLRQLQPGNISNSRTPSEVTPPRLSLNSVMLNGSLESMSCPNDLLVRARNLGIKILTIEMVVRWIMNLPSDVQSYIESTQRVDSDELREDVTEDTERDRIFQVRHLKPPCIKVLDLKSRSRPLYLDHTDYLSSLWARPRLKTRISIESGDTSPSNTDTGRNTPLCSGSIPGASLGCAPTCHPSSQLPGSAGCVGNTLPSVLSRQNSRGKRKDRMVKRSNKSGAPILLRSASVSKVSDVNQSKPTAEDEPSGYCECCSINYGNLFEHLHCKEHQQFATNRENYRLLDDVLSKLPSVQMFLAQESDAASRLSEKSVERKRHRSRQSSGAKTTSKPRQASETIEAATAVQVTKKRFGGASAADAGHAQQNRLFSDDEESNQVCDPLVEVPTDIDSMRTVTDIAAEAILAGSSEELPVQAPQFVPVPSESVIPALEKPVESGQLQSLLPAVQRDTVTHVHVDLQPLLDNTKITCPNSCSPSESPVLKQYHGTCRSCFKAHIPFVPLPCHLQIHCLLGPAFNWERLGCQGFASPFSLASSCSSENNSCDVEYDVAATAAAALILSEQLRDDRSQRSQLEKAIPADELYITPPQSPVFDQIDSCVSVEDTQSTVPCFIPDSPLPSPVCTVAFNVAPLAQVSSPIPNQNPAYRPAFLSPLSEKCPPQFISTPLGSPQAHTSPRDVHLNLVSSVCASPSSTHSDSDIHRNSSVPKLNSASFECSFPMDPVESKVRPKVTKGKLPKSPTRYRQQSFQSHSLSECNGLSQLPVVRRPKLSAKSVARQEKKEATNFIYHRAKSNVRPVSRKRPIPLTDVIPDRFQEPRMAAKIARESISLSVRALFSPSGMERCFEARNPLVFAAGLSHIPVTPDFHLSTPPTPPGRRTKARSVCRNNLNPSESSIHKYGRTLFPEPIHSCHI